MGEGKYPECEKLANHSGEYNAIIQFLEFIREEKGYTLEVLGGESNLHNYVSESDQELIYEYLGIDPMMLECERREILEEQIKLNSL